MRPLRTASLLVAFYVLVSVGSSYAECAWVLWGRTEDDRYPTRTAWLGHAVYPSHERCWNRIKGYTGISKEGSLLDWWYWVRGAGRYDEQMRTKDVAHLKENDVYIGARDNGAVIISQHTTTGFQCLPDTLRPLGLTGRSR